jgi:outer membrane protein
MTLKSLTAIVSRPMPRRLIAILAVSLCTFGVAEAQELKIGFVRVDRINESNPAKAAIAKMEQEFSKREKELRDMDARLKGLADKLDKDMPVLSESDRVKRQRELTELDKDLQRKNRELREDFNQRRNEDTAAISERARKVIVQIAEKEKYDLILTDAVYASPKVDITDKLLTILNK